MIDWSAPSISGGPEVHFVHQPTLEQAMHDTVVRQPTVELHLGWELTGATQDKDLVRVDLRNCETGEERTLTTRFLVGCDGANSTVRGIIGGEREDRGFEADWLVIDVLLKDGATIEKLGLPAAGQYCNPVRPTTIVPAGIRDGKVFRRWEFMRLPGETVEELESEERVWSLLSRWAGPDDVELVRHKVYNFRSLIARNWRDRRILIAGDAAHVMPPFMGQGMCAGMRDAWNLQWKLRLMLDGKADERILDTYQMERQPHVSQITDISIYLGKMICIPDEEAAAQRDAEFFGGLADPPPPFPSLAGGLIRRTSEGELAAGAGMLSPHVNVEQGGKRLRLDDVLQGNFALHCRGIDLDHVLTDKLQRALVTLDIQVVSYGSNRTIDLLDLDGGMEAYFDQHGWVAFVTRPDFYVYGAASHAEDIDALLADLLADASNAGIRLDLASVGKHDFARPTHEAARPLVS